MLVKYDKKHIKKVKCWLCSTKMMLYRWGNILSSTKIHYNYEDVSKTE